MAVLRVLVTDDDPKMHALLDGFLTRDGHECRMAQHGAEALDVLKLWQPDVILLDLEMPVMTGYEFLEVRQTRPDLLRIPVVVLSASPTAEPLREDPNVAAVVAKPFRIKALMDVLATVIPGAVESGQPLGAG